MSFKFKRRIRRYQQGGPTVSVGRQRQFAPIQAQATPRSGGLRSEAMNVQPVFAGMAERRAQETMQFARDEAQRTMLKSQLDNMRTSSAAAIEQLTKLDLNNPAQAAKAEQMIAALRESEANLAGILSDDSLSTSQKQMAFAQGLRQISALQLDKEYLKMLQSNKLANSIMEDFSDNFDDPTMFEDEAEMEKYLKIVEDFRSGKIESESSFLRQLAPLKPFASLTDSKSKFDALVLGLTGSVEDRAKNAEKLQYLFTGPNGVTMVETVTNKMREQDFEGATNAIMDLIDSDSTIKKYLEYSGIGKKEERDADGNLIRSGYDRETTKKYMTNLLNAKLESLGLTQDQVTREIASKDIRDAANQARKNQQQSSTTSPLLDQKHFGNSEKGRAAWDVYKSANSAGLSLSDSEARYLNSQGFSGAEITQMFNAYKNAIEPLQEQDRTDFSAEDVISEIRGQGINVLGISKLFEGENEEQVEANRQFIAKIFDRSWLSPKSATEKSQREESARQRTQQMNSTSFRTYTNLSGDVGNIIPGKGELRMNLGFYSNNPLNIKTQSKDTNLPHTKEHDEETTGGYHRVFNNLEEGMEAARWQIERYKSGENGKFKENLTNDEKEIGDATLGDMYRTWATSANDEKIGVIAKEIGGGVTGETKLSDINTDDLIRGIMKIENEDMHKAIYTQQSPQQGPQGGFNVSDYSSKWKNVSDSQTSEQGVSSQTIDESAPADPIQEANNELNILTSKLENTPEEDDFGRPNPDYKNVQSSIKKAERRVKQAEREVEVNRKNQIIEEEHQAKIESTINTLSNIEFDPNGKRLPREFQDGKGTLKVVVSEDRQKALVIRRSPISGSRTELKEGSIAEVAEYLANKVKKPKRRR